MSADAGTEAARERVAEIVVTLRAFTRAIDAFSSALLLDQGEEVPPLVVTCPFEGSVSLSEGDQTVQLEADRLAAAPLPLPEGIRALPPFDVDAVRAEITAPLGGIEHHARAVVSMVAAFPGRSVLTVTFATTDEDTPLHLAARRDDPVVLALGEETFEMAPGWPAP